MRNGRSPASQNASQLRIRPLTEQTRASHRVGMTLCGDPLDSQCQLSRCAIAVHHRHSAGPCRDDAAPNVRRNTSHERPRDLHRALSPTATSGSNRPAVPVNLFTAGPEMEVLCRFLLRPKTYRRPPTSRLS